MHIKEIIFYLRTIVSKVNAISLKDVMLDLVYVRRRKYSICFPLLPLEFKYNYN